MNNNNVLIAKLMELDLGHEEAKLYVKLLEQPNTHLQLARQTGINRTKVYRLVESLEKQSLVTRRVDDRGMVLIANDPGVLEVSLSAQEAQLNDRRKMFSRLLPDLRSVSGQSSDRFAVQTYEGIEGFKQMQWHELEAKTDLLVFGNVTIEQLVSSHYWAEKLRSLSAARGYKTRELFNNREAAADFTKNQDFINLYEARVLAGFELPISTPMVIYNDTVAIYQLDQEKRVGVEVINAAYAETMRSIFEHYWRLGRDLKEKA